MATFQIKDKSYINTLATGDLFLVQTDPGGSATTAKFPWESLSGVFSSNFVTKSVTGQFSSSGNLFNTGSNLSNQIIGLSGVCNVSFLSGSLTGQFGCSGNLTNTGVTLRNEIVGLSGAFNNSGLILINHINNVSGLATNQLTGISVTGSFPYIIGVASLSGIGGARVILSGNNTILFSGGAGAGGGEVNTASNLGSGLGVFSDKNGVDLRFFSLTGGTGISLSRITNDIFVNSTTSANLFSTGSNLHAEIIGLSGINNQDVIRTYVTGISVAGGGGLTGLIGLSGAGNISISRSGQTLYVSGDTGAYANFLGTSLTGQFGCSGNLLQTGIILHNEIVGLSGALHASGQLLKGYINTVSGLAVNQLLGIYITGGEVLISNLTFSGIGGTRVIQSGNNIVLFSGGAGAGGGEANTASNIGNGQGLFAQKNGVDLEFYNITGGTGISCNLIANDIFINCNLTGSKSITIDFPISGQKVTMFKTYCPVQVTRAQSVLITGLTSGQTRDSYVNYSLRFDPSLSAVGSVICSGFVTDQTTGDLFTSFTNSYVSGNCWVWYTGHSTSGNINQFSTTLFYI